MAQFTLNEVALEAGVRESANSPEPRAIHDWRDQCLNATRTDIDRKSSHKFPGAGRDIERLPVSRRSS